MRACLPRLIHNCLRGGCWRARDLGGVNAVLALREWACRQVRGGTSEQGYAVHARAQCQRSAHHLQRAVPSTHSAPQCDYANAFTNTVTGPHACMDLLDQVSWSCTQLTPNIQIKTLTWPFIPCWPCGAPCCPPGPGLGKPGGCNCMPGGEGRKPGGPNPGGGGMPGPVP